MLFKSNGIFEVPSIPALPSAINLQHREKMEALSHHPMETYLKKRGNYSRVLRYGQNKYSIILINRSTVIAISKCKLHLRFVRNISHEVFPRSNLINVPIGNQGKK